MNKDVKAKWLAKLREPSREQTRGYLQNEKGQCCLDVLCGLAILEDGSLKRTTTK